MCQGFSKFSKFFASFCNGQISNQQHKDQSSCWYSLDSSHGVLSDDHPHAKVSVIFPDFLHHFAMAKLANSSFKVKAFLPRMHGWAIDDHLSQLMNVPGRDGLRVRQPGGEDRGDTNLVCVDVRVG